jgi:thioredoxin 1
MIKSFFLFALFLTPLTSLFAQSSDSLTFKGLDYPSYIQKISAYETYVLVHFKADWCIVCKREFPLLQKLQADNVGRLTVIEVDLDANPLLGHHYEIDALPAHFFYSKGEIKWHKVGLLDPNEVMNVMKVMDRKNRKKK